MQVHLTLKGSLASVGAGASHAATRVVDLPDGADAAALLTASGLDRRGCVVVVNGSAVAPGTALRQGDRVQVYPAQAGG